MKRVGVAVAIGLLAVCLLGTSVSADDPIDVDIVVLGDGPTVTVDADGDNPTIYINGQDIQEPTVHGYEITVYQDNPYDDTALWMTLEELEILLGETGSALAITGEGLAKVIVIIGEHTDNLRELLGLLNDSVQESLERDNELVERYSDQEGVIAQLGNGLELLESSFEEYKVSAAEDLASAVSANQDALSDLRKSSNARLALTAGVLGFLLLLLGFWNVWQIRLARS